MLTLANDEFDEIARIILLSVSIVFLIVWTVALRGHAYRVLIRSERSRGAAATTSPTTRWRSVKRSLR